MLLWQSAMYNKCDKVWEGWHSVHWKGSRKWARFRTPHRMRGYGRFLRQPLLASLATALLYSPSCRRLHELVALSSLLFSCQSPSSFSLSSQSQFFLPFDVATISGVARTQPMLGRRMGTLRLWVAEATRGCGGMLPQKILEFLSFLGRFWGYHRPCRLLESGVPLHFATNLRTWSVRSL